MAEQTFAHSSEQALFGGMTIEKGVLSICISLPIFKVPEDSEEMVKKVEKAACT